MDRIGHAGTPQVKVTSLPFKKSPSRSFWPLFLVVSLLRLSHGVTTVEGFSKASNPFHDGYRYRTAKEKDIAGISDLLQDTFESTDAAATPAARRGDDDSRPWWKNLATKNVGRQDTVYYRQLVRRWSDMVQNPHVPHTWIVVDTTEATGSTRIAGFMELGTMPSPIPIREEAAEESNDQNNNKASTQWHGIDIEKTVPLSQASRPERPFLANLAVSKEHRRKGIATTLVQLALKLSQKWNDGSSSSWSMYLGVDKDNAAATQLYTSLNFTVVLDESVSLPANKLKGLSRPPRLYYEKEIR